MNEIDALEGSIRLHKAVKRIARRMRSGSFKFDHPIADELKCDDLVFREVWRETLLSIRCILADKFVVASRRMVKRHRSAVKRKLRALR